MGRLWHLVNTMATGELTMRGARALATMGLAHFSWNIPIPATKMSFFSNTLLSMCTQVQFSGHTFCTETHITPLLFSRLQIISIISRHINWLSYLISVLSSLNHARHLMAYTVKNQHVFKSEILPKWMTKIFYSQMAVFVHDLHDYKLWNTARWQEPALDKD